MYTCMISLNRHGYIYKCEYVYVYTHIASPPSYVYIHMYINICIHLYCLSSSLAYAVLSFFTLSLSLPNTYTREMCVCIYTYMHKYIYKLEKLAVFLSLQHFFPAIWPLRVFGAKRTSRIPLKSHGSSSYPWKREYELFVYNQSAHVQLTVGKARKDCTRVNESQRPHVWMGHGTYMNESRRPVWHDVFICAMSANRVTIIAIKRSKDG